MRLAIPALAAVALLGACATATPYQPALTSNGGYQNQQIEANRWAISFSGNSLTDRQTVESYLLYRAAELTQQNGYDNFEIVTRETDAQSRFVSTGFSSPFFYNFYGYGGHTGFGRSSFRHSSFSRFGPRGFGYGFYDPFYGGPASFNERVNYEATAEIIMHRGEKPTDSAFFNAEDVLVNLSGSIVLPKARSY